MYTAPRTHTTYVKMSQVPIAQVELPAWDLPAQLSPEGVADILLETQSFTHIHTHIHTCSH